MSADDQRPEWLQAWHGNQSKPQKAVTARDLAIIEGRKTYFIDKPCPRGHVGERWVTRMTCVACGIERDRIATMTPERAAYKRVHNRASQLKWRKANRGVWNAIVARRKARKRRAVPAWADEAAITAIYVEAERLTRDTGIEHHVDHIVPLRGRAFIDGKVVHVVCGLHCEANLRPLPGEENERKNCWHWPDMP